MVLGKDITIAGNTYAGICDVEDASRCPVGVDVVRDAQMHASLPCPRRVVVAHYVAPCKLQAVDRAA